MIAPIPPNDLDQATPEATALMSTIQQGDSNVLLQHTQMYSETVTHLSWFDKIS